MNVKQKVSGTTSNESTVYQKPTDVDLRILDQRTAFHKKITSHQSSNEVDRNNYICRCTGFDNKSTIHKCSNEVIWYVHYRQYYDLQQWEPAISQNRLEKAPKWTSVTIQSINKRPNSVQSNVIKKVNMTDMNQRQPLNYTLCWLETSA